MRMLNAKATILPKGEKQHCIFTSLSEFKLMTLLAPPAIYHFYEGVQEHKTKYTTTLSLQEVPPENCTNEKFDNFLTLIIKQFGL